LGPGEGVGKEGKRWELYSRDRKGALGQEQGPWEVEMWLENHFCGQPKV